MSPLENNGEITEAFESLEKLQEELEKLDQQANEEVMTIVNDNAKEVRPLLEKRSEHIEALPNFWMKALLAHPFVAGLVTDADEDILLSLTKLDLEEKDRGFVLTYHFDKNEYFYNATITKSYSEDPDNEGEYNMETLPIQWKNDKEPKEEVKTDSRKRARVSGQYVMFDESEEEIGLIVREEIWPNPLDLYLHIDEDYEMEEEEKEEDDEEEDLDIEENGGKDQEED